MLDLDPAAIRTIDADDRVRRELWDRVRSALSGTNGKERVVRVGVSFPETVCPIDWIRAQDQTEAVYWSGRNEPRTVGAVGAVDVVSSSDAPIDYGALHDRLHDRLRGADAGVRYYGGLRFDATQPPAGGRPDRRWAAFGTYRFVLPRFEIVDDEEQRALVCNLVLPTDSRRRGGIRDAIANLALPVPNDPAPLPRPSRRKDVPDQDEWTRMVYWALDAIHEGDLDKVVLARRVGLALDTSMDPLLVLGHLQDATPRCFHFAVRPANGPAFVGASPERLFWRDGTAVTSEAVAGTRPRGRTPTEDEALRNELFNSPKERREHAFVQEAIQTDLQTLCTTVHSPDGPSDLALARGRHLHSRIDGTLKAGTTTEELLEVLHPTPAVGGVPTDDAISAIRSEEPFDRGWYAGPVGWIGREKADFAVGLRAGLAWEDRLALFSGAGLVEGSQPSLEWDEIEQKIGDFAAIMGVAKADEGSR